MNATNNINNSFIITVISVILSTNVVPINPQKYTIDILAIIVANKNFLYFNFDNPAPILIEKAGVNGIAIIITNFEKLILLIIFISFFVLGLVSIL